MGTYHQITLSEWMEQKEQLRRELNNVREGFVRVGYVLRRMEETKAYEAEGYKSVAEFAEKEHGLRPYTTSRWMAINREFSLDGYSMQLDPKYIGMNGSQLTEMLTLSLEDRELVLPETQRETIRELRRLEKENPAEISGFEEIVKLFFDNNTELRKDIAGWICFRPNDLEGLVEQVNPSGNRSYRKNGMMLMMYKDYVMYKAAGQKPEKKQWEEFFEAADKIIKMEREEDGKKEHRGDTEREHEDAGENVCDKPGRGEGGTEQSGEVPERGESGRTGGETGPLEGEAEAGDRKQSTDGGEDQDKAAEEAATHESAGEHQETDNDFQEPADHADPAEEKTGGVSVGSNERAGEQDPGPTGSVCGSDIEKGAEDPGQGECRESHEGGGAGGGGDHPIPAAGEDDGKEDRGNPDDIPGEEREKEEDSGTDEPWMNPPEEPPCQIAPAQNEDEEMSLTWKIKEARKEVRICIGEVQENVNLRRWGAARKAAAELMKRLEFLEENEGGGNANTVVY